jgi:hypothetical protein
MGKMSMYLAGLYIIPCFVFSEVFAARSGISWNVGLSGAP